MRAGHRRRSRRSRASTRARVTAVDEDDIDEFLRFADPDGLAAVVAAGPEERAGRYDWYRMKSIHVHCWHEEEFVEVLEYAIRELGHSWEFLDGVIAADEGPPGIEFGYVLRKSSTTADRAGPMCDDSARCGRPGSRIAAGCTTTHSIARCAASDGAAMRTELDAFRHRRVVRASERAAGLVRAVKARSPVPPAKAPKAPRSAEPGGPA